MKRFMILLTVFGILLTLLAGCGKDTDDGEVTTEEVVETEGETSEYDEWGRLHVDDGVSRELDFGNTEISLLLRAGDQYYYEWYNDKMEDAVDEAVFERNAYVSEQLGVVFNYYHLPCNESGKDLNTEQFNSAIINDRSADLGTYDIVSHFASYGAVASLMDCYVNLLDEEKLPYLDFDKPWWNAKHREAATVNDQLYFAVGHLNLSFLDRLNVIYFNIALAEAYGLPNMYELVLNGEWTYEKLYEYANTYYEDRDNSMNKNENDFYAVAGVTWTQGYDCYLQGFEQYLVQTNDDGTHTLRESSTDIWDDATDKIYALFNAEGSYLNSNSGVIVDMFANNQILFAHQVVSHNFRHNAVYRDMEDEFGILPIPKYDDNQKEYGSNVGDCYNIQSIPSYSSMNGEMLSAVLELMYAESYRDIYPYYFERILKTRYVNTEDSSKVFDLILDRAKFDYGQIYAMTIGDIVQKMWREPSYYASYSVPRLLLTYKTGFNKELQKLDEWFGVIG